MGRERIFQQQAEQVEVTAEVHEVLVDGQRYNTAVYIIGGGTGLEALNAANALPDAAIFVVDPYTNEFGQEVIQQLANPGKKRQVDWDFFKRSSHLQDKLVQLWQAFKDGGDTWKTIDSAYKAHFGNTRKTSGRIFFDPSFVDQVKPQIPTSSVLLLYPNNEMLFKPEFFQFANKALSDGGVFTVATESDLVARYNYIYPATSNVSAHGHVTRNTRRPQQLISAFDGVVGKDGYFYVVIQKKDDKFPTPSDINLYTASTPFGMIGTSIAHLLPSRQKLPPAQNLNEKQGYQTIFPRIER